MIASLKLNSELKLKIQHVADLKQRSAHWIMCEAIRIYVEQEQAREAFKQEAIDSWAHYQETGLHLSEEEAQKWLSTWGTEAEKEAPECHE
ncbi:MAG: CopG family ribbon-helix-helix protein [Gammaproteobacteria bacterium]|nr:CopG family ribbon-helix-helix protein [Gammaproteobacteria bacterium]